MTQQTEQICFRYDGSEEAEQGVFIKCLNKENISIGNFITSDGWIFINQPTTHRLVTPAEFLRLVSEAEWTPKHGEEVEVSDNLINWHKYTYIGKNPHNSALPYVTAAIDGTIMPYKHIRPIRKSLRDELIAMITMLWCEYNADEKADEILSKFNVTPKH